MIVEYTKLESIHSALQELQNRYAIPNDDVDLDNALQFTEDLREPYLKENENEWHQIYTRRCRVFSWMV